MKIYEEKDNVYDAVDAVIKHGIAAIAGTKGPAVSYSNRVIKCLKVYPKIQPSIGYQNVSNQGYLYYVHDLNVLPIGSEKLESIISQIDAANT